MKIVIEDIHPFDLAAISEGGQAFRWNRQEDGSYTGVVGPWVIEAKQQGDELWIDTNAPRSAEDRIRDYFDLNRDYKAIEVELCGFPEMVPMVKFSSGYRILRQDPWETTISFIISANNHIRNIKNTIELLCQCYGEPIAYKGKIYYAFPTPEALAGGTAEELKDTRCGYRDRYILGAAEMIARGEVDLEEVKTLPTPLAKKELLRLPGVGPKVANCILLYSMQKFDALPVDVWIKRALEALYFNGKNTPRQELQKFAEDRFGPMAGFAQQYLFRYFRTVNPTQG